MRMRGEVSSRTDADDFLEEPGDGVLVRRGVLRSLVLACPDGCGDVLTVNLDKRAGPAWRIYRNRRGLSVYPSIWRESGCESHFIVWRSKILWCDFPDETMSGFYDSFIEFKVLNNLDYEEFKSYEIIADALDEVPWEVARACQRLVERGLAVSGRGRNSRSFRRT